MVTPWDEFIDSIERRKRQLDEVLEAYKLFRQKLEALPPEIAQEAERMLTSGKVQVGKQEPASNDFMGKISLDCVKIILAENDNEPMHFEAVAKEALKRGYKGRASGSKEEVESRTMRSFWAAMSRSEDLVSVGKGFYKLREWPKKILF